MFYNTVLIYVLRVLASHSLENLNIPSSQGFIPDTLPTAEYLEDQWKHTKEKYVAAERLAALDICRCIPYYLSRKPSLNSGSPVVHWAITTAWMTLRGKESAEGRWITDLLNKKGQGVIAKGLWVS